MNSMLGRSVNKYDSKFILSNPTPVHLNTTIDPPKEVTVMSMSRSAAAAGSNDTVVNSTAKELVCGGKIKIG